jgi:hypothetical protein
LIYDRVWIYEGNYKEHDLKLANSLRQYSFGLNIKKAIRLRGLYLNGLNARDIDMNIKVCKYKSYYLAEKNLIEKRVQKS